VTRTPRPCPGPRRHPGRHAPVRHPRGVPAANRFTPGRSSGTRSSSPPAEPRPSGPAGA